MPVDLVPDDSTLSGLQKVTLLLCPDMGSFLAKCPSERMHSQRLGGRYFGGMYYFNKALLVQNYSVNILTSSLRKAWLAVIEST